MIIDCFPKKNYFSSLDLNSQEGQVALFTLFSLYAVGLALVADMHYKGKWRFLSHANPNIALFKKTVFLFVALFPISYLFCYSEKFRKEQPEVKVDAKQPLQDQTLQDQNATNLTLVGVDFQESSDQNLECAVSAEMITALKANNRDIALSLLEKSSLTEHQFEECVGCVLENNADLCFEALCEKNTQYLAVTKERYFAPLFKLAEDLVGQFESETELDQSFKTLCIFNENLGDVINFFRGNMFTDTEMNQKIEEVNEKLRPFLKG